ncbi:hypothetical protein FOPG_18752 [Fusarium oxysporum f. sp. conglutinans race 2 54008]|uniref:Uncharacterized protein n=1 Tax=Fusarium oxysporum f. sp. conglutinans race 2 54008 TaxID=1089457 RepID=X0GNX0_FUSOX|nr:hypothetical protein FOPG_18752 [Fusarium oxysporum f. sp. conglutinans race 2 54008]
MQSSVHRPSLPSSSLQPVRLVGHICSHILSKLLRERCSTRMPPLAVPIVL